MTTSSKCASNSGAGISRRAFVTGAAAAGTIATAVGLAGCSQPASDGGTQTSSSGEAASGVFSWETPPAPIDDADIADTYDCEVCVVGAGLSGVTTALRAAEEGLNVLVLQNLNEANTQGTGASAVNSKRQIDQGLEISDADRAELMRLKCSLEGGLVNYDLFNLWMDNSGADLDYDKSPKRMHAVKTPPFYAIERKAYILGTLNGLDINTNMQVLNTEGEVIPGLYAAGNASGGNFFGGLAQGMAVPASTISRAITWGYLVAGTIAENE